MKKRYFLTGIVPKHEEINSGVSIAMCNFSRNLMSGGLFDKVFSILAVFVSRRFKNDSETEYLGAITRLFGKSFRKISPILEQIILFFKIERGASLWLYNMTMLNELLFLLLRRFKPSVKIYTIVLDFTPGAKNNNRLLKRINSSDGLIVLSDNELFTNHNKICLPGVVPKDWSTENPFIRSFDKKRFLLSGVMSEQISQISKVLEVFSMLPECELNITGQLDDNRILEHYKHCPNIKYHGKVSWDDYIKILHSCQFVLSTRDINAPENKCNFPSKIIEALLHNRIIVSTIHYDQLKDLNIFEIGNELNDMRTDIDSISKLGDDELLNHANQSKKTKELFNVNVWKDAITHIENNSI